MISNEKIYKIAKNLHEFTGLHSYSSPTNVVTLFKNRKDQTTEYIRNFGPDAFVKICIAMWGISRQASLEEIEKWYEELFFATVFYTDGDYHEHECDQCDGNGSVDCDYCDGNGRIDCDDCDGSGKINCETCDGDGEVEDGGDFKTCEACNGDGDVYCDACDGDGYETCDECSGGGTQECGSCDGNGTIESDFDKNYYVQLIASWNPSLRNKCELEEETMKPITSQTKFESLNSVMVLNTDEDYAELDSEVRDHYVYCLEFMGDSPKLHLSGFDTKIDMVAWDADHLLL